MRPEDVPAELWDAALVVYHRVTPHDGPAYAMRAALAAVAPMIAQAEREACAKIINDRRKQLRDDASYWGGPDTTNRHIIEPELMALDQAIRAHPAEGHHAMSDTQRCEPPEELRGVDGEHHVFYHPAGTDVRGNPVVARWGARYKGWWADHLELRGHDAVMTASMGWRYLAPVTPSATVAALVEALEAADQFIRNGIELGYIRMPSPSTPDPALETPDKVANALALYRGDVA